MWSDSQHVLLGALMQKMWPLISPSGCATWGTGTDCLGCDLILPTFGSFLPKNAVGLVGRVTRC